MNFVFVFCNIFLQHVFPKYRLLELRRTIDIDLRLAAVDRQNIAELKNLPIYLGQAGYVTLDQIAKISYEGEDGLIKRYDLMPTVTVSADVKTGTANDATKKAYEATKDLRDDLPLGCSIEAVR